MNDAARRPRGLVTGASSGIGAALARELAKDGHDLVLAARRVEPMKLLAEELKEYGADVVVIGADLSKAGAASDLVEELCRRGLSIDVLINNAGVGDRAVFAVSNPVRIHEMLQVNIVALTELTRLLLPAMIERKRGKIMLLASTAGFQPGPYMAVYCAAKAYVLSLGAALGYELRDTGVTVTTLCPGPTATEFAALAGTDTVPGQKEWLPEMAAAEVASLGYRGLKARRSQVVPGFRNKITAYLGGLLPHCICLPITASILAPTLLGAGKELNSEDSSRQADKNC